MDSHLSHAWGLLAARPSHYWPWRLWAVPSLLPLLYLPVGQPWEKGSLKVQLFQHPIALPCVQLPGL